MAFRECQALTSIVIPENTRNLSSSTFYDSDALKNVYFKSITPPSGNRVFRECDALENIYVPKSSVDQYKTSNSWLEYADLISGCDF